MKRKDIATKVSNMAGIPRSDCENVIDSFVAVLAESLKNKEKVVIRNFATFEVVERAERTGRNPATGEIVDYPAKAAPKCKFSKILKDTVSGE